MIKMKEQRILSNLRKNARMSVSEISRNTNIPVSTVFNKIKQLEDSKIIKKYSTLLNYQECNYNVRVFLAVKVKKHDELVDYLLKHKSVNSVWRLAKEFDFLVDVIFLDLAKLYDFITTLDIFEPIVINEHFIIEDIQNETFLSVDKEEIFYPPHIRNSLD